VSWPITPELSLHNSTPDAADNGTHNTTRNTPTTPLPISALNTDSSAAASSMLTNIWDTVGGVQLLSEVGTWSHSTSASVPITEGGLGIHPIALTATPNSGGMGVVAQHNVRYEQSVPTSPNARMLDDSPFPLPNTQNLVTMLYTHRCHWSNCGEFFRTSTSLHNHVKTHTKALQSLYICHWASCAKTFQLIAQLNKHLQLHTKPFICTEGRCRHLSATSRDLRRHTQTHRPLHIGDMVYHCPVPSCEHSIQGSRDPFRRLDNAQRHIINQHQQSIAPITSQI